MNEGEQTLRTDDQVSGQPVKFLHYRGGYFRSIHADGVWGALTGYGNIHLSFFNERPPMPETVIQEIGPDGQWIAKEPKVKIPTDANVARQFEVEVILSVESAKVVRNVLNNFLELAEKQMKGPPPK